MRQKLEGASPGCVGTNYGSFTLAAVSATSSIDIIQTCTGIRTICTNCNTRTPGTFNPGIEVYTYEGNVNLDTITSLCCRVILSASICCRNNALTTMQADQFYTSATINRCQTPCNSAPTFTNDGIPLICSGIDFVYNLGAIDPDGDSLSYAFGESFQGAGSPVSYYAPFSAANPFAYFGAPNGNAPSPAGLRINPITGDIMFRPIGVFVSQLVIEVTQWRLVSGVRVNVGVTRRDLQLQTTQCSGNLAPIIKIFRNNVLNTGINSFSIEAGKQICLDIVAEDRFSGSTLADTTDLRWNSPGLFNPVMANATFVRNYILAQRSVNGPKADSFKFCWTPPVTAIRTEPYLFTVSGIDRFCPVNTVIIRGVSIIVIVESVKTINITSAVRTNFCASQTTNTSINYAVLSFNLTSSNVFNVQLSDSIGNFNSFTNIGTKTDSLKTGSINITIPAGLRPNGAYKIRVVNTSDTSTLAVPFAINISPTFAKPIITVNKDSFCKGTSKAIFSVLPTNSSFSFSWLTNNILLTGGATNDSLFSDTTAAIKAIVSNGGCVDTSLAKTIIVYSKPTNINYTVSDSAQCLLGNNFVFTNNSTPNNSTLTYLWKFSNGDTSTLRNPIKVFTNVGPFIAKMIVTANNKCVDSFQSNIIVKANPTANFLVLDSIKCLRGNSFSFVNSSVGAASYSWAFGDSTNSTLTNTTKSYTSTGGYFVKLVTTDNGCTDSITKSVLVLANANNVTFTTNQASQCLRGNNFVFTNNSTPNNSTLTYLWKFSNGDISTLRNPIKTFVNIGTYATTMIVTANNICVDSFQSNITVLPNIQIGTILGNPNPSNITSPFSYSVFNKPNTNFNWSTINSTIQSGQATNQISVIFTNIGNAKIAAQITDNNGCSDSTSLNISVTVGIGINELSLANDLKVYPNPTKSIITITNKTNLIGKKYVMTNLIGQIVLSGKLNSDETIINTELLINGVYLLSIDGMNKQAIKIVKE
jgi:PKD repeat protein